MSGRFTIHKPFVATVRSNGEHPADIEVRVQSFDNENAQHDAAKWLKTQIEDAISRGRDVVVAKTQSVSTFQYVQGRRWDTFFADEINGLPYAKKVRAQAGAGVKGVANAG
jgi:hypothetical protein